MWPEVKRSVYFDTKELGNSCVVFPYCVFFYELFGDSSSGQILIFFHPSTNLQIPFSLKVLNAVIYVKALKCHTSRNSQ